MFSDDLKHGTATAHLELEKKMIPHLKKITSTTHYIRLLDYLHSYYDLLEQQLQPWMLHDQRKPDAERIRFDLNQLQPGYVIKSRENVIVPRVDSYERALGVLYVLEGSTLGGQIITGMLTKQLGTSDAAIFTYYNPYGDGTSNHWQAFKDRLNQPLTDTQRQQVTAAANETFETLKRWISDYGSVEA
jgi:heme oxygenase (biliverdin-IX-beta and delta-forming)